MRRFGFFLVSSVLSTALLACSAGKEESSPTGSLDGSLADGSFDVELNVDGLSSDGTVEKPATLKGKVVAPEGTIPIFGALVYTTPTAPPPIPDKVYCDKCVKLVDGTPFTTTAADGSFTLPTVLGEQYLVVQKGAFRRVRTIKAVAGEQTVPKALTTLPPKTDKAKGDDVPKIAVALGAWDPVEIVLARLGLEAKITVGGFIPKARVLSKDATGFAIYGVQELGETSPYPNPTKLLTDPAEISKYHVVFIPCSGGTESEGDGPKCSGVWNSGTKATVEGFVKAGGRVYVSDWSYEYVRQTFSGFVNWRSETSTIGSACEGGGGDQAAKVEDPDLAAWFKAQGKSLDTVKDAWTHINKVNAVADLDPDGKAVTSTPKVWVSAAGSPATTSFEHSCGRVLYTTYHTQPTSEGAAPLEPQALALLYLILEVNVCVGPPIIK
ncbi:MAG: hypothetical protein HYV09_28815 [Deltaproteobacteria bacterium]|nr:hypothetical protein [Deltaproteobacteria bacterium]